MERINTQHSMQSQDAITQLPKLRTLIVDDTPELLEYLIELVGKSGAMEVVGGANDGLEALQMAAALKPDLVLMDVNMPRMDGLASTREMKQQMPGIQVILMSAEDTPTMRDLATRSGADQFIAKAELLLGTSQLLRMLAA